MSGPSQRGSRWRRVVTLVPVAYAIGIAIGTLFVLNELLPFNVPLTDSGSLPVLGSISVVLIFLATVLLPYALHRDIRLLNTQGTGREWQPDRQKYVRRALYGLAIPGVTLLVSGYYLYRVRNTGVRS